MSQEDTQFKPGQSGNPNGRPKGSFSIKSKIIQRLEDHPEECEKLIDHLIQNKQSLVWQMIDGRPTQQELISADFRPTPILNFLPIDNPSEK